MKQWGGDLNYRPEKKASNKKRSRVVEPVKTEFNGVPTSLCMLQTRDGRYWLGTWEHGLLQMNSDGSDRQDWSQSYDDMYHEEKPVWDKPYPEHWVKQKRSPGGLYYA